MICNSQWFTWISQRKLSLRAAFVMIVMMADPHAAEKRRVDLMKKNKLTKQ